MSYLRATFPNFTGIMNSEYLMDTMEPLSEKEQIFLYTEFVYNFRGFMRAPEVHS